MYVVSDLLSTSQAVAIRTRHHIDALISEGHEVLVLTKANNKSDVRYKIITVTRGLSQVFPGGLLGRLLSELIFSVNILFVLSRQKGYDHVIITSPPFFMTLMVAASCRLQKLPYSVDIRDRYPQVFFSLGILLKRGVIGILLLKLEKNLYKGAVNIMTVTDSLAEALKHDHGLSKVVTIMNGYDEKLFNNNCRHQPPAVDNPFKIIIHGNFGYFFDEKVFRKIIYELNRRNLFFSCVLIGTGEKLEIVRGYSLPNLEIIPAMDQVSISAELMTASFGLSLHTNDESMLDAFPVKVFEYIGASLPCAVIPRSQAGVTIEKYKIGFSADSNDYLKIVDYIELLANDKNAYRQCVNRLADCRHLFSRQKQACLFAKLF